MSTSFATTTPFAPMPAFARAASVDPSSPPLTRALLGFVAALLAAGVLRPGQGSGAVAEAQVALWVSVPDLLLAIGAWVPFGFLLRRARPRDEAHWSLAVLLYALVLAAGLECARTMLQGAPFGVSTVAGRVGGALVGASLLVGINHRIRLTNGTITALLLDLPLMSVLYLLLPLVWVASTLTVDDPNRVVAVAALCLGGASILGSVAKSVAQRTITRPWWIVGGSAALWAAIGLMPLLLSAPWTAVGIIGACALAAGWRGRLNARPFQERRFEVPALRAALPMFIAFMVVTGIWPAHALRTRPIVAMGFSQIDGIGALWVPLIEALIAAALLGYIVAEWHGRRELSYRRAAPRVLKIVVAVILAFELLRAFLAADGASVSRAALSTAVALYGAWLYHLQRDHVKAVVRRSRAG